VVEQHDGTRIALRKSMPIMIRIPRPARVVPAKARRKGQIRHRPCTSIPESDDLHSHLDTVEGRSTRWQAKDLCPAPPRSTRSTPALR